MLKLLWFVQPPSQDLAGFEQWYQDEHVPIGMRQERLQRFRINRSLYPQPGFVAKAMGTDKPEVYRFSEGYWLNADDMRHCYASVHGRAALADGTLNMRGTAVPTKPGSVLVMEEEAFPVAEELAFNVRTGKYRGEQACKLFGFVKLRDGTAADFDKRYAALARDVASDPDLRGHIVSRSVDEVIRPGRLVQWPPVGADHYDRTVEFYFESPKALERFAASAWMGQVTALIGELATARFWDAAQIQEVFYTTTGDQPLEESWKALFPA
jgi:hypothetical protein